MREGILREFDTTLLKCDMNAPASNGRVYPREVIKKSIAEDKALHERIINRQLFGEFGFSNTAETDLSKVAFSIESLYWYGDELKAHIVVLDTPNGRLLNDLMNKSCEIKVSAVGTGEVNENNEVTSYTLEKATVAKVTRKKRKKDINSSKYAHRKEIEYDDDIGILFYKGQKVTRSAIEDYKGCWLEENEYFDDLAELLDDIGYESPFDAYNLDEEDRKEKWETVWDNLEWNKETKSYKYKNWELIVLDI